MLLLAERPVCTMKYYAAMAAQIPILHVQWAVRTLQTAMYDNADGSCQAHLLPISDYLLDVGHSQASPTGITPSTPLGSICRHEALFRGWTMQVTTKGSSRSEVTSLLAIAGAKVVTHKPAPAPYVTIIGDSTDAEAEHHTLTWISDQIVLGESPAEEDVMPSIARRYQNAMDGECCHWENTSECDAWGRLLWGEGCPRLPALVHEPFHPGLTR